MIYSCKGGEHNVSLCCASWQIIRHSRDLCPYAECFTSTIFHEEIMKTLKRKKSMEFPIGSQNIPRTFSMWPHFITTLSKCSQICSMKTKLPSRKKPNCDDSKWGIHPKMLAAGSCRCSWRAQRPLSGGLSVTNMWILLSQTQEWVHQSPTQELSVSFTFNEVGWNLDGVRSFIKSLSASFFWGWIKYTLWTVRLCSWKWDVNKLLQQSAFKWRVNLRVCCDEASTGDNTTVSKKKRFNKWL